MEEVSHYEQLYMEENEEEGQMEEVLHNGQSNMEKNEEERQMEEVLDHGQSNMEEIDFIEEIATLFNHNSITDKYLEQRPRQYRGVQLHFDTPMEEEDITEWIHLEPIQERVSTSLRLNKNTEVKKNKHLNLPRHENLFTPLPTNIQDEENNMRVIRHLKTENNALKSENIRLRKQIRNLRYLV